MRCIALFSGGLDSMIAIKLIKEQNIDVIALHIDTGFGDGGENKAKAIENRAKICGADYKKISVQQEFLDKILFSPKYGYGKHFNPCIDCHGFMFKTAISLLEKFDAKFLITGEVLGERPMSQRSEALKQVCNLSGDKENLILRPLSAKLLPPTKPEILGWVNRQKLLDISGRGRKRQFELAKFYNFEDYETPAGGCLLTLEAFSNKIKDFVKFNPNFTPDEVRLLKVGRHLRLPQNAKMVIGKDENQNKKIIEIYENGLYKFYDLVEFDAIKATSLVSKTDNNDDLKLAAKLALAYSKAIKDEIYQIKIGDLSFECKNDSDKTEAAKFFV